MHDQSKRWIRKIIRKRRRYVAEEYDRRRYFAEDADQFFGQKKFSDATPNKPYPYSGGTCLSSAQDLARDVKITGAVVGLNGESLTELKDGVSQFTLKLSAPSENSSPVGFKIEIGAGETEKIHVEAKFGAIEMGKSVSVACNVKEKINSPTVLTFYIKWMSVTEAEGRRHQTYILQRQKALQRGCGSIESIDGPIYAGNFFDNG